MVCQCYIITLISEVDSEKVAKYEDDLWSRGTVAWRNYKGILIKNKVAIQYKARQHHSHLKLHSLHLSIAIILLVQNYVLHWDMGLSALTISM